MDHFGHYASPLGGITLASDGTALVGLWFDGQKYFADTLSRERVESDLPVLAQARRWLDIYFSGAVPDFSPPLTMRGASPFRRRVWELLLSIPYGKTSTYGEIAGQIACETGCRVSAQAVGGAVGHNPVSLIIPCHRVVGANGSLTGYAGGLDKKIALLRLEGVDVSAFSIPKSENGGLSLERIRSAGGQKFA